MDLLQTEDELLLMELERRDGIYSFIFHELEANFEENQNKIDTDIETKNVDLKDFFNEQQTNGPHQASSQVTKSPLLDATASVASTSSRNSYSFGDCFVNRTSFDLGKSWQANFNFQFPVTTANSAFQQFCAMHTFNVRRAKTPFSHLDTPLVRNRRHKLKEAKEYKNFMASITKVADLRELFPLDPDVHAPFLVKKENSSTPIKALAATAEDVKIFRC